MRFSTKLTLFFSLVGLIFIVVSSYIGYESNVAVFEVEIAANLENYALHTMDKIDRLLYEKYAEIKHFANDPVIMSRTSTPELISRRLREFLIKDNSYASLTFYDASRVSMADTNGINIGVQHPLAGYWTKFTEDVDPVVDINVSTFLKKGVIYFASTVRDNSGKKLGAVVSRLPLDALSEIIAGISAEHVLGKNIQADLLDNEGLILYSNYNREGILRDVSPFWDLTKTLIIPGKRIGTRRFAAAREDRIFALAETGQKVFKVNGWKLLVSVPAKEAFAPVIKIRNKMFGVSVGIGISALIMTYLFSLNITRPLNKLSDGLEEIGRGNLELQLEADSKDEIGLMARNFNAMANELNKQRTMLVEYGNELRRGNEELKVKATALRQRDLESNSFSTMSEMLHACQSVEEASGVIANAVQLFFPNDSGAIYVFSSSRNILESITQWGQIPPTAQIINPNDCWGLRRGRPHLVSSESDPRCPHAHDAPVPYICIPMVAQGETLGMLYLHLDSLSGAKDIKAWSDTKSYLIMRLAENAGLAITNLKLRETLKNLSVRDPLTGLFNRRYMSEALELERHRSLRKESPIGILMIDIDHFKLFNDTFGHDAGDTVLKELGMFLQKNIRGGDVACRYGGEEFTVIMPGAALESAMARANILLEGVRHIHVVHGNQSVGSITLSIGVAIMPEHGGDANAVLQSADAALYRAKNEGRNRVCSAAS